MSELRVAGIEQVITPPTGDSRYSMKRIVQKDTNIVARRIADEVVLVPIRRKLGEVECIYTLNEVGARIWELIDGTRRVEEIRDLIVSEFEVSRDEAEEDLLKLFQQFTEIGAVDEVQRDRA